MSPRDFIKHEPFIWWFVAGIKWAEGVFGPSNLSRWHRDGWLVATRPVGAARPRRCTQPAVVAHWSRLLPALRSTKHDKVFTYGIRVTPGTHLAHLGLTAGDDGAPCSSPRVNVWWLQGFAGLQNRRAAVVAAPETRGVLQLWWESVEDGVRRRWLGF
jgi:hypothetical protein